MKKTIYVLFLAVCLLSLFFIDAAQAQGQFVGSKNSDVYHYPSCYYVDRIKPENLIWFSSAQDAVNHGYRPCLVCNPPLPSVNTPVPTANPTPAPTMAPTNPPTATPLLTPQATPTPAPTLSPTLAPTPTLHSPTPTIPEINGAVLIIAAIMIILIAITAKKKL